MKPKINRITDEWIEENHPCQEALDLWKQRERAPLKTLRWLIKIKKYDWANWFIVRIMTYHDYVSYAVFAAEQVIKNYEEKYPNDKRPRKAIEAAKKCIENPSEENKSAAWSAWSAAWSAWSAAWSALQLKILKYGIRLLK